MLNMLETIKNKYPIFEHFAFVVERTESFQLEAEMYFPCLLKGKVM